MQTIHSLQHEFYKHLTEEDEEETQKFVAKDTQKELYRLSDATGQMKFTLEKKGNMSIADFDTKVHKHVMCHAKRAFCSIWTV